MNSLPLCSIVVTSYNKCDFIGLAVESALAQTYGNTEVIIVDDGSTDGSVDIVMSYHDRAVVLTKPNGGQASAVNEGYAASHGEIVVFLDGDDLLDHDTIARVVAAWSPDMAKLHYPMRAIDGDGVSLEKKSGASKKLPSGNLTRMLRRFGFYPSPPTSGNAYARRFLDAVMPLPETVYRLNADTPLIGVAPLFGSVGALDEAGASYRLYDGNGSRGGRLRLKEKLASDIHYIDMVQRLSQQRLAARWPLHLKERLLLLKFWPDPNTRWTELFWTVMAFISSVWQWPEYRLANRVTFSVWAIALLVLPSHMLRRVPRIAGAMVILESA